MQLSNRHIDPAVDRSLLLTWKVLVGLVLAGGLLFLATVAVESLFPQLPDQARADTAMRPTELGIGGVVSRSSQPQLVEHFHAQFNLRPSVDAQGQPEAF